MDNFDLKKYLANNILLKESTQELINKEIERLGLSPDNVEVIMKEGEEQLDEGLKDKITNLKSAMAKTLLVCSIAGGVASCQKENPHVYKFSYNIEIVGEQKPQEYKGVMLQPYSPQERVGTFYELEDHKLSEPERQAMEEKLMAQEKARLTGKDYIMIDSTAELTYMGPSKHGDIETK